MFCGSKLFGRTYCSQIGKETTWFFAAAYYCGSKNIELVHLFTFVCCWNDLWLHGIHQNMILCDLDTSETK